MILAVCAAMGTITGSVALYAAAPPLAAAPTTASPTAATSAPRRTCRTRKRNLAPAAGKQAVVALKIAQECEVRRETALLQHAEAVAAYRKHLAGLDRMVCV